MNPRVAVIDIGSNSGRVTVLEVGPLGHLDVLSDSRAPLRLERDLRGRPRARRGDHRAHGPCGGGLRGDRAQRGRGPDRRSRHRGGARRRERAGAARAHPCRGGRGRTRDLGRGGGAPVVPRRGARAGGHLGGRVRHRRRQPGGDDVRGTQAHGRVEPAARCAAAERPVPAARSADRRRGRDASGPRPPRAGPDRTGAARQARIPRRHGRDHAEPGPDRPPPAHVSAAAAARLRPDQSDGRGGRASVARAARSPAAGRCRD